MQLLIDADMILYKFGFRNQEVVQWTNGASTEDVDFFGAVSDIKEFTSELLRKTKCTNAIYCISSKTNFRHKVLPTYKHNRDHANRPIMFGELKKYMRDNFKCLSWHDLEADDVMGIMSTKKPLQYCIATLDKDLRQIPGWHFNWNHDTEPTWVTPFDGECLFYKQILMGDGVDGYSGCPKIGKVKSAKSIEACIHFDESYPQGFIKPLEVWDKIVETYAQKDLDVEYILQQARMARILQIGDIEWSTKKPLLWCPSSFDSVLPNE